MVQKIDGFSSFHLFSLSEEAEFEQLAHVEQH